MPNQPVILNGLLFLAHLFSIEGRCHRQRPSLFIWITASSLSIRSRWKLDRFDVIDTNDLLFPTGWRSGLHTYFLLLMDEVGTFPPCRFPGILICLGSVVSQIQ
jgi:hypothetical protein